MARTLEQIQNEIIQVKESEPALAGLSSTSKTAIWRLWIFVMAFAIYTLELIFDNHKEELSGKIRSQKTHKAPWVRGMLLNFQYGFDLIGETDLFDNQGYTQDQIEASKIIKYAAVTESVDEKRLICKIATESNGELSPLSDTQIDAVKGWLKQVKAAGIPYTVINYLPDLLQLHIRIFRDPLVLDAGGVHRVTGKKPVEEALKDFMRELPFDGELRLQDLANKLEQTDGVHLVEIDSAQSAWIDATTNNYGAFTLIDVRRVPVSGYFKIQNFDNITYVV